MARLPELDYEYTDRHVTDCFLGYRHRYKIGDGEFYETRNLTTAEYPLLANRKKRAVYKRLTEVQGLLAKDKLVYADNGTLYIDGVESPLKSLSAGRKQLVSMGSYICIFPDKMYCNTADPEDYGSMEARYSSTGAVKYSMCRDDGTAYERPVTASQSPENPQNGALWIDTSASPHVLKQWNAQSEEWTGIDALYTKISFVSEGELEKLFSRSDGVSINGAAAEKVNGLKIISAIGTDEYGADYIVVPGFTEEAVTQTEGSVNISRTVPEMDYICECRNRLWGCRYGMNGDKNVNEIYGCALGDFKNWNKFEGLGSDAWAASVGSDGAWTGAVNYLGYPTFFKEDRIHRVAVSAYGAHQLTETVCRGVQQGSEKSLAVVNETLLYKSRTDICAYQGGFPESVSDALGELLYCEAAAGAVGDRYYISMKDSRGCSQLFVYDLKRGLWMHEDELGADCFARLGDELFAVSGNNIVAMLGTVGSPEKFVEWEAESGNLYYQYPDKKYVSRYSLRVQMEEGARMEIFIQYDSDGQWHRQGEIRMKGTGTVNIPVRPRRCDHMRIKLHGKGEARLYSIARILSMGSEL